MKKDRFYKSNGILVPSGTTVLPRPYLAKWAANCAVNYIDAYFDAKGYTNGMSDDTRDQARTAFERESMEAADYGTYIHTLCQYSLMNGIEVELPHICPKCRREFYAITKTKCACGGEAGIELLEPHKLTNGFMEGFWKWKQAYGVKPIVMEHEVLSKWYGGRLDLVCEMDSRWMTKAWCKKFGVEWYKGIEKQRVIVLVDFKTGKSSYYETWKYQLAGYRQAYNSDIDLDAHDEADWDNAQEENSADCWRVVKAYNKKHAIAHHGVLKFNKETGKVNYKDFTVWETTRTVQDAHRLPGGSLRTEKYIRTYETDRATFNALVGLWWLQNRGITI